jgi:hypothetical protein
MNGINGISLMTVNLILFELTLLFFLVREGIDLQVCFNVKI